jgi:hypothetical protein
MTIGMVVQYDSIGIELSVHHDCHTNDSSQQRVINADSINDSPFKTQYCFDETS